LACAYISAWGLCFLYSKCGYESIKQSCKGFGLLWYKDCECNWRKQSLDNSLELSKNLNLTKRRIKNVNVERNIAGKFTNIDILTIITLFNWHIFPLDQPHALPEMLNQFFGTALSHSK